MKGNIKKYIMILCIIILFTTNLVGCSYGKEASNGLKENNSGTNDNKSENNDSSTKEGTRIISTVKGDVEVPSNPQRVIVNWYIGDVFTLDIIPVAASAWSHETMPFYDKFEGVANIENWAAEEIMSYEPDLIITYSEEDFDNFSKIAPVIVIPEVGVSSTERLKFLGEVTGREAQAKAAIDKFEQKLASSKEKLTGNNFESKTFSILQDWGASSYGIYYETGSRGGTLVYEYLGLKKPQKLEQLVKDSNQGRGSLSYEVAADYFGDYVLWFLMEDYKSEFAQTEIWNSIPAVKNGNVISIPSDLTGLFFYSDVTSLTAQLDYIVERLMEINGQ